MSGRQINVRILHNLRLEAGRVARPNLPFAGLGFDREPTWIDLGILNELATKWARTVEADFGIWIGCHHLTRMSSATAGGSERGLQWMCFHNLLRGIRAASG